MEKTSKALLIKSAHVWIVQWQGHGLYSYLDKKVEAILNHRKSETQVEFLLEQFLVAQTATPAELVSYAQKRELMPYKAKTDTIGVFCGQNPSLVARRAFKVKIFEEGAVQHIYGEWRPSFFYPKEPRPARTQVTPFYIKVKLR